MTCPKTTAPCPALGGDGKCYGYRLYGKREAQRGEPFRADCLAKCPWGEERKG